MNLEVCTTNRKWVPTVQIMEGDENNFMKYTELRYL